MKNYKSYWDARSLNSVKYKNEIFYTITPIPFYKKRREVLLKILTPYFLKQKYICDFGCGDGWYVNYFKKKLNIKNIIGFDLSQLMIQRAKEKYPNNIFVSSNNQLKKYSPFDIIYLFAIMAHNNLNDSKKILINIDAYLHKNGKIILFEQVALNTYSGNNFYRRSIKEYHEIFLKNGFKIDKTILVDFKFHRFFERYIAKKYYYLCKGKTNYQKRLNANKHSLFRFLSFLFVFLDKHVIKENINNGWGNAIFILSKNK